MAPVETWLPVVLIVLGGVLALVRKHLWIGKIFAFEFGRSDVQANYSRTYSWLANQLGHMTLGLGTTLAYYWFVELFGSWDLDLDRYFPDLFARPPGGGPAEPSSPGASYLVATLVATAGVLAVNLRMLSGRGLAARLEPYRAVPGPQRARHAWLAVTTLLALGGAALVLRGIYGVVDATGLLARWFEVISDATGGAEERAMHVRSSLVALGSGMAAMSVWLTKEFCSDQAVIEVAIAEARWKRAGKPGAGPVPETGPRATAALRHEGWWDSATDGFFYVSGAIVAVGILASHPNARTAYPESAFEMAALVLLLAVFLVTGRIYGYRQRAIDWSGAPYCTRLALSPAAAVPEPAGAGADGLDWLFDFATREPGAASRHLVVHGAAGIGKSPLVIGLATEAALAPIPVEAWRALGRVDPGRVPTRYAVLSRASLEERADLRHREKAESETRRGMTDEPGSRAGRAGPGSDPSTYIAYVEEQVLVALDAARFVVLDDIADAALDRIGQSGAEGRTGRLEKFVEAYAGRPGRYVWALNPPPTQAPYEDNDRPGGSEPEAADRAARVARAGRLRDAILRHAADRAGTEVVLVEAVRGDGPGRSPTRAAEAVATPAGAEPAGAAARPAPAGTAGPA